MNAIPPPIRAAAAAPFLAAATLVVAALAGQSPGSAPRTAPPAGQAPSVPAPGEAERTLATRLLRQHAAQSAAVKVLVADYVQRRTTELSATPLVSRGEFLFVRDPGAVVFRASEPRISVVRLTATRYEVWRPQQQRLERFVLDGPELAEGLFAAVGGDADRLLREFELVACAKVAPPPEGAPDPAPPAETAAPRRELVELRMRPRDEAMRARLRELILTLGAADAVLAKVAYRDAAGDLVEIELRQLRADPERPPSAELDVPPGATVLEHAPPAKR